MKKVLDLQNDHMTIIRNDYLIMFDALYIVFVITSCLEERGSRQMSTLTLSDIRSDSRTSFFESSIDQFS